MKIAIIHYSMYGHVATMSESIKKGVLSADPSIQCDIYQVPETLPEEVLAAMHAPPKGDYPVITKEKMTDYDGFLFGIPGRFGMMPAQMRAFMDTTGGLWFTGALVGKPAGVFFSTSSQGGGQETIALTTITFFVHQGMIFVPLGYSDPNVASMDEMHGSSPYGAGTFSKADGSRQPSDLEKGIAETQGKNFAMVAAKLKKVEL